MHPRSDGFEYGGQGRLLFCNSSLSNSRVPKRQWKLYKRVQIAAPFLRKELLGGGLQTPKLHRLQRIRPKWQNHERPLRRHQLDRVCRIPQPDYLAIEAAKAFWAKFGGNRLCHSRRHYNNLAVKLQHILLLPKEEIKKKVSNERGAAQSLCGRRRRNH